MRMACPSIVFKLIIGSQSVCERASNLLENGHLRSQVLNHAFHCARGLWKSPHTCWLCMSWGKWFRLGVTSPCPCTINVYVDSFTVPLHCPSSKQLTCCRGCARGLWRSLHTCQLCVGRGKWFRAITLRLHTRVTNVPSRGRGHRWARFYPGYAMAISDGLIFASSS